MSSYEVTWRVTVESARDPIDAARRALKIQRDPESIATIFDVWDPASNMVYVVDLDADRGVTLVEAREAAGYGTVEDLVSERFPTYTEVRKERFQTPAERLKSEDPSD